jgi:hypothetical protein
MRPELGVLGVAAVVTAGVLSWTLVLASTSPQAAKGHPAPASSPARLARSSPAAGYSFRTVDEADQTFNRLLGINNLGHVVGGFGSGAAGHPHGGYLVRPPYGQPRYQNIDVPGSVQTQLTGLNDAGIQVGFWSAQNNASEADNDVGFYLRAGSFSSVSFPTSDNASPPVNQLLGVNDNGIAVGCYADSQGHHHGYRYDIATGSFTAVTVPGATSGTAAAINNAGGVAGFFTSPKGVTSGFFLGAGGRLIILHAPGAATTRALGVNDSGEVVGDYRLGKGAGAVTHGFTWTRRHGFTTVDDPRGVGTTTINGINNAGDLVGFYIDGAGHTEGLLATPTR